MAPSSATIGVGGQQRLTATGTFSDGSIRPLSGDHSVEGTDEYTCFITTSGAVKCWGGFTYQTPTTIPAFEKAVSLSAGTAHVCALFADGTVNCQGRRRAGRFDRCGHRFRGCTRLRSPFEWHG